MRLVPWILLADLAIAVGTAGWSLQQNSANTPIAGLSSMVADNVVTAAYAPATLAIPFLIWEMVRRRAPQT